MRRSRRILILNKARREGTLMTHLTMKDGTRIFVRDWGQGQPIIFLHGWPLTADMWDNQMFTFGGLGYRVIAYDRRGFGRSSQKWENNTNEQSADDLAEIIEQLELSEVVLVGHSMSGGDFAKYVSRHGTGKLAKIVTTGANLPQILQHEGNPDGEPKSTFDDMRNQLLANRAGFFKEMPKAPFGFNKLMNKTDEGLLEAFWHQAMLAGIKPAYDYIAQFSEPDFTADIEKIDVPTLIIHGDEDQGTPIKATALRASQIIPHATLKVYEGGTHMIPLLQAEKFNADLLAFIRA
jgi:non-heme chloroperoxidase